MSQVFLSYSTKDYFFAELAMIKLGESGIVVWRDQGQLRAGSDWRQGIERGIADSLAVLVALSVNSASSSYVTFEWAYALGQGKPVIPVKLTECEVHPKLETIQHLDFTVPRALPWESLVERIHEVESAADQTVVKTSEPQPGDAAKIKAILAYLDQRGYQVVSFGRLRRRVEPTLADDDIEALIKRNSSVLRRITTESGNPGLAKVVP